MVSVSGGGKTHPTGVDPPPLVLVTIPSAASRDLENDDRRPGKWIGVISHGFGVPTF